ncbi:MAG: hypothetical protein ACFFDT_08040 [Candidatus Hodarchaeota archaeon]
MVPRIIKAIIYVAILFVFLSISLVPLDTVFTERSLDSMFIPKYYHDKDLMTHLFLKHPVFWMWVTIIGIFVGVLLWHPKLTRF